MKKLLSLAFALLLGASVLVACGGTAEKIQLGTYNPTSKTFTALEEGSDYTLEQMGTQLTLKGAIPYSSSILGVDAGNIVAIRFQPASGITPGGEEAYVKTTNRQDAEANGWNEYGEEAFEEDGSLVWVTSVSKENTTQIKIKWNETTPETTYTLTVDPSATLASNS